MDKLADDRRDLHDRSMLLKDRRWAWRRQASRRSWSMIGQGAWR